MHATAMTMSSILHRRHFLPDLPLQVEPQAGVRVLTKKLASEHENEALVFNQTAAHAWVQPK